MRVWLGAGGPGVNNHARVPLRPYYPFSMPCHLPLAAPTSLPPSSSSRPMPDVDSDTGGCSSFSTTLHRRSLSHTAQPHSEMERNRQLSSIVAPRVAKFQQSVPRFFVPPFHPLPLFQDAPIAFPNPSPKAGYITIRRNSLHLTSNAPRKRSLPLLAFLLRTDETDDHDHPRFTSYSCTPGLIQVVSTSLRDHIPHPPTDSQPKKEKRRKKKVRARNPTSQSGTSFLSPGPPSRTELIRSRSSPPAEPSRAKDADLSSPSPPLNVCLLCETRISSRAFGSPCIVHTCAVRMASPAVDLCPGPETGVP